MDRPEDIEVNPVTGTRLRDLHQQHQPRHRRQAGDVDTANPRAAERQRATSSRSTEAGGDHAATTFTLGDLPALPATRPTRAPTSPASPRTRSARSPPGQHRLRRRRQPVDRHRRPAAAPCKSQRRHLRRADRRPGARPRQADPQRRRRLARSPAWSSTHRSPTMFVTIQHPGEGGTLTEPPATGRPAASPCPP